MDISHFNKKNGYKSLAALRNIEIIDTEKLFWTIYEGTDSDESYFILSKFVKKYEVFKKIFDKYDDNYMKIGNDYKNLEVYVIFTACLLRYYIKHNNLKFLNAIIKLNDLLCSVRDDVKGKALFNDNLLVEMEMVKEIISKKGLKI